MGQVEQSFILTVEASEPGAMPAPAWEPTRVWEERIRRPREDARRSRAALADGLLGGANPDG